MINFFSTLALWQWLVLLSIPPLIVLLYFLKLKRQPLEVPSTFLWHRTIEDLHVNSLWQRLRQNLLLLLQLLLLLLAILACLRPSAEGNRLSESRYVFLVDTSASMSATDVEPTRLEAAKQQLIDLIDQQLPAGSVAMVISFSDRAIVEQPFTSNRRLLRRRIRGMQQTQRPSELDEALRVAAGLANPGRSGTDATDVAAAEAMPASLVIFSDGRFRTQPRFAMGNLKPIYVPIGVESAVNVGIVAFGASETPDKPDQLQVFARLQNFGSEDASVTTQLSIGTSKADFVDAAQVDIPAGGIGGVEFLLDSIEAGELIMTFEELDDLAIDNTAYAAVNRRRQARVLYISPRNDALDTVLSTNFVEKLALIERMSSEAVDSEEYLKKANSGAFDLIIFDQCRPAEMPACNTYFIGILPPDPRWTAEEAVKSPQIIDSDRSHPLMRFVELGDVKAIVEATPLNLPRGGNMLIDSHLGVIMGVAPREGYEDLVQGFEIVGQEESGSTYANTDWPIRTGFPVFIGNVLTYLGGSRFESEQVSSQPGQAVALRTQAPVEEINVESPAGERTRISRGGQNTFVFGKTDTVGNYSVREASSKDIAQRFAVNLFDTIESDIRPSEAIDPGYEQIVGQRGWETKRRELWKYLLIAGLIVLLVEWYIYNRRVYV